jgi:hypothetical protein
VVSAPEGLRLDPLDGGAWRVVREGDGLWLGDVEPMASGGWSAIAELDPPVVSTHTHRAEAVQALLDAIAEVE